MEAGAPRAFNVPGRTAPEPSSYTFFLLGPPTLCRAGLPLALSTKGRLLLLYLSLEGRPVHRATLAALLWPDGDGLRSLRVELSKLRRAGLPLGEAREPLLQFSAEHLPCAAPTSANAARSAGDFLQDCEQHGSPAFRDWVLEQRLHFTTRKASGPAPMHTPREQALAWLAQDFQVTLQGVQRRAQQTGRTQILLRQHAHSVLPHAALDAALAAQDWRVVTVECGGDHRLFLTALLLRAEALLPERQRRLTQTLQDAPDDAALLDRISAALLTHDAPLLLVLQHAARLSEAAAALLTLAANWPTPLVLVLLTEDAAPEALTRSIQQVFPGEQFITLAGARLPSAALSPDDPPRFAWHIQQSEGRWPVLDALLQRPLPLQGRVRLDPSLQQDLLRRLARTHPHLITVLAPLAMLPGPFPITQALALLPDASRDTLRQAVRAGVLQRVPPFLHLNGPEGRVRIPDEETPLAFASELTRSALAATLKASERRHLRSIHAPLPVGPAEPGGRRPVGQGSGTPPDAGAFIHALDLHGGYAAELWTHRLTLYRLGASGHRPVDLRLTLPFDAPGTGAELWYQTASLDGVEAPGHLRVGHDRRALEHHGDGHWRAVPIQPGRSRILELHVRAVNLILHVHLHGLARAFPAWSGTDLSVPTGHS